MEKYKKLTKSDLRDLKSAVKKYTEASTLPDHEVSRAKIDGDDCELCDRYYINGKDHNERCAGCPIRVHAEESGCRNTPYFTEEDDDGNFETIKSLSYNYNNSFDPFRKQCAMMAEYLQSLIDNNPGNKSK